MKALIIFIAINLSNRIIAKMTWRYGTMLQMVRTDSEVQGVREEVGHRYVNAFRSNSRRPIGDVVHGEFQD